MLSLQRQVGHMLYHNVNVRKHQHILIMGLGQAGMGKNNPCALNSFFSVVAVRKGCSGACTVAARFVPCISPAPSPLKTSCCLH